MMRELREKHLCNASPPDMHALGPIGNNTAPSLSSDTVEGAIRSFHRLSGAGPSGLRPLHLQEALCTELRDEVIEHTTTLVQLVASGRAPQGVAPWLAGATLTALPKKDGSVRPIAVGETLRRLTGSLCKEHQDQAKGLLFPLQISVAQPFGAEVGLQTARQWCERNA